MSEYEHKITEMTYLATWFALNTRATEIENKIPDTAGFINTPDSNRLRV